MQHVLRSEFYRAHDAQCHGQHDCGKKDDRNTYKKEHDLDHVAPRLRESSLVTEDEAQSPNEFIHFELRADEGKRIVPWRWFPRLKSDR